ncbi:MAG: rane-associated lipoprotein involved in thiamine biosynthesis [Planctomycetota bacterium]|nr:rane-associated lipoprotein involved in thiamine biosynthesis [Planctomycetota bacterium]
MGSFFEVRIPANTPAGTELACRALDRIDELEAQLTVYRDDSEVSRLNAKAHLGPIKVDQGLFDLLRTADEIGRETQGAYDVTAGALSAAWGFTRGPKRVPDSETLTRARERTGRQHLHLDTADCTVGFDREGVVINLGSIGKGYAIDEAARVIRDHWWPTPALIHGGQSSVYALGSPPGLLAGRWSVSLRNPFDPSRPLGIIQLCNRALGTSGAAFQQFEDGGRMYGHILDPRTGEPPEHGPASVSVLAPSAAEADALSTAFYLMGPVKAAAFLANRPEIGAILVLDAEETRPPRMIRINVSDEDYRPDPSVRLAMSSR